MVAADNGIGSFWLIYYILGHLLAFYILFFFTYFNLFSKICTENGELKKLFLVFLSQLIYLWVVLSLNGIDSKLTH